MMHNIERHPLGGHIGYCKDGFAFRIRKTGGGYLASPSHAAAARDSRRFTGSTLNNIGDQLAGSVAPVGVSIVPASTRWAAACQTLDTLADDLAAVSGTTGHARTAEDATRLETLVGAVRAALVVFEQGIASIQNGSR